jgi:hypothetical protein
MDVRFKSGKTIREVFPMGSRSSSVVVVVVDSHDIL